MSPCPLKERMHSFEIGIVVAVLMIWIGWGMVLITWATSGSGLNSAQNRTGRPMTERSALLAADSASMH